MNTSPCCFKAKAGIDNEMRPLSFFRIRHLFGHKRFEGCACHALAGHDALALDSGRRGDDEDGMTAPIAVRFEEKWNIENGKRRAGGGLLGEKQPLPIMNQRMDE